MAFLMKKQKVKESLLIDKMKHTIFLLFAFFFLYNCTSNTIYKKPSDLIPKDSMAILIQEMVIASSSKNMKTINSQRKVNYFPLVYDRFKIDSTRFQKSSFYYTSKIDDWDEILTQVSVSLELQKEKYSIFKKRKDSIARDSTSKLKKETILKKGGPKELIDFSRKNKRVKVKR